MYGLTQLSAFKSRLGRKALVRDLQLALLAVLVLPAEGDGAALGAPAQKVDAYVAGQPVEPDGELALSPETAQGVESADKGLLSHVARVLLVADHPQSQTVYFILMFQHQSLKGLRVPGAYLEDDLQLFFPGHEITH